MMIFAEKTERWDNVDEASRAEQPIENKAQECSSKKHERHIRPSGGNLKLGIIFHFRVIISNPKVTTTNIQRNDCKDSE